MTKATRLIIGISLIITSASVSAFSFKSSDFNVDDKDYHRTDCVSDGWGDTNCSSDSSSTNSPMRWKTGSWNTGPWGGGPFNMDSRNWSSPWSGDNRNRHWGDRNNPWSSTPWNWNNRGWGNRRAPWNGSHRGFGNPYRGGPYGSSYGIPYDAGPKTAPGKPHLP